MDREQGISGQAGTQPLCQPPSLSAFYMCGHGYVPPISDYLAHARTVTNPVQARRGGLLLHSIASVPYAAVLPPEPRGILRGRWTPRFNSFQSHAPCVNLQLCYPAAPSRLFGASNINPNPKGVCLWLSNAAHHRAAVSTPLITGYSRTPDGPVWITHEKLGRPHVVFPSLSMNCCERICVRTLTKSFQVNTGAGCSRMNTGTQSPMWGPAPLLNKRGN